MVMWGLKTLIIHDSDSHSAGSLGLVLSTYHPVYLPHHSCVIDSNSQTQTRQIPALRELSVQRRWKVQERCGCPGWPTSHSFSGCLQDSGQKYQLCLIKRSDLGRWSCQRLLANETCIEVCREDLRENFLLP